MPHDHIVVLEGVTWADYQRHLEIRGERPVPRFTYLQGRLEITAPSRSHEHIKSMIGRLVEAWCLEHDVDISAYGSWTIEDKAVNRGAEPDECYVLGDVRDPKRPDLAIEVVWTSGGIEKLEVYSGLRVREVWIWKDGQISVYELEGDAYAERERSVCLPALDVALLSSFVDVHPMTRAVREYRVALRSAEE
jgi:Uma2 family endonuclease